MQVESHVDCPVILQSVFEQAQQRAHDLDGKHQLKLVTDSADNKSQMSASPGIVSVFHLIFTRVFTVLNMHTVRVSEIRGEPV